MLCSFSWSRLMPTYITTLAQVKKESVLTYRLENGHIRRPTKEVNKMMYLLNLMLLLNGSLVIWTVILSLL
ncbi:hypothetical protein BS78_K079600 [Paspalum vaginatum]|uniref:Uncharacterized protein n=1 Tax=Paspalum vaginatum TaxID=158149 RepID=A0A9W8CES5_9POAL|nr:hypothetical protein BS78_K207400 [Paspalum vaginatum]KAJ1256133.1 hypothetical protein BS78_K079600 [Paspalum vaginatum]